MPITVAELQRELDTRDKGVLKAGVHTAASGEFCGLEFATVVRGKPFNDAPGDLPDLRPLNDGPWSSDQVRTAAVLPVLAALWDWPTWTSARRQAWTRDVVLHTVTEIVSRLPGLDAAVAQACREATDLKAAEKAAAAAAAEAAAEAEWAAARAARAAVWAAAAAAARAAAEAARSAAWAADHVLQTACTIWIAAAEASAL